MTDQELIQALNRLKVETGSLACLGCGHEHNCGVHGCAVIREAADRLTAVLGELEQVTRERDAAIADLKEIVGGEEICLFCTHNVDCGEYAEKCHEFDFDCKACNAVCRCRDCHYNSNWQWRGPKEAET